MKDMNTILVNLESILRKFCKIIIWCCFVRYVFPACFAFMDNHPALLTALIECDGTHECLTRGGSVSGAFLINMFGVQTVRAMIAVASVGEGFYLFAAVFAGEGFLGGDEDHINTVHLSFSSSHPRPPPPPPGGGGGGA